MTDATNEQPTDGRRWLVWSNKDHKIGFWKANRCGYTQLTSKAGRFTRAEAEQIAQQSNIAVRAGGIPRAVIVLAPDGPPSVDDDQALLMAAGETIRQCSGVRLSVSAWSVLLLNLSAPEPLARAAAFRALADAANQAGAYLEQEHAHCGPHLGGAS